MTFERTGRDKAGSSHSSQSIHHVDLRWESAEEAYAEFGRWMDDELVKFEACFAPLGPPVRHTGSGGRPI